MKNEAIFEKHMNAELAGDLETTMLTMSNQPHLYNIPTLMGGEGVDSVKAFYQAHLVGKFFPPDMKMTPISRTIGEDQIVDEIYFSFTHTQPIDWMLPNINPTGKKIEIIIVAIVKFNNQKIVHEHIYWDQASLLYQIGLLDKKGLPIVGAQSAQKIKSISE
ncbi:MAG: hypothetical protein A3F17_00070 [Gammaproteobacteria bacterium RIFCSPHIGHO2_12_FULL_41_15]|nr:MAG: hypothetical protein A3F17_00070 [Gammaproteobacteria bacterium RIFCSPHIGHO2_12_FULL_41_15]